MKYLCLIHLDEQELDAMPAGDSIALNRRHLAFNDELRAGGQLVEADALEPARQTATIRVRQGKTIVTDGPFAEAKEMVAGFYLIEAPDLAEAVRIASRIPSAYFATIEVRPTRQLIVDGPAD